MKKSRFREQQIAFILRQAEEGATVEEVWGAEGGDRSEVLWEQATVPDLTPPPIRR